MAMTHAQKTNRFSRSIDASRGVDKWLGDGCELNHQNDWLRLKGIPEEGGTFSVTNNYEKGELGALPEDSIIELQPGERVTIYNRENVGAQDNVWYNVIVKYEGPAPPVELLPDEDLDTEPPMPGQVASPTQRPVLTRLAQRFPFFQRFLGGS